ncbi:PTS glucose transporter subunit IIBC [Rodentibacter rarus]|uniref:PTS glucose transporter subunit IIBC n=1 Tax=Rodentibacter rarus TaxID=1908260 RepID=A0A1V3IN46_9PAST|nr:N-acetylglucosamine-specific PTS transporter subunit IIBC [Rodentibacter rarus]OOF42427.1 PTS glucose transporter subunit IIBC [Rodentibacter rarus]OOF43181.1 PTS glucose transporter subunit IIBC [Rodentibacter rarus]
MSVLSYAQKIGQALMVPVAALPAAALLMGIGYWIDPDGWGTNSQLAALLIKSGAAIIDNMGLLFAVGVAFGLSKDKHGSAALSGLVGFYVVTTLLSPGGVAQLQHIDPSQVPAAFGKINNQFIGILIGVISAELYNRFYQVELPKALSFFSGKRLVPIVVAFVMIALSFLLLYVWPPIFNGLVSFGESIKDLGAVGAGIYGFFNRLLISVGLHHALNSVFWFDVAGINDIPNFLGGAKSLAEGTATVGVTGMYQAGFFPVMMFGLPGAALAIYHSAKPGQKAKVASIMLAAAFASFFTGITEPLEFSFMFVAPILYVIHALLTGLSVFIAASMHWIAGFGFSAGLVDMVLSSRNPLAVNWYMLIVQGVVFFAIYYVIFRAAIKVFNLKTLGREDQEETQEETAVAENTSREETAIKFIDALGGKENFKHIDACITRLRLTLVDHNNINEVQLRSLGSKGNIKIGNDGLQVILGPEAELVAEAMKRHIHH